jgi:hypothetical protein
MLIELASPAARTNVVLMCNGSGASEGYLFGRRQTGQATYRVELRGAALSVFDLSHGKPLAFCPPDAECSVIQSTAASELKVRSIPRRDPLYRQSFLLDRTRSTFRANGGGLDGGWTREGACEGAAE